MSTDQGAWDRARTLKLSNMPDYLFRYRAPSENSLKGLQRKTIWLSAASQFNDLHDTTVAVDAGRDVGASLRKLIENGALDLPQQIKALLPAEDIIGALDALFVAEVEKEEGAEAAARVKGFLRKFLIQESAEWSSRISQFMQRATKVACFCEAGDVPLLWAHYADSHRGFCIEYQTKDLAPDDLRMRWLLPVIYQAKKFNLTDMIQRSGGMPTPFVTWLTAIHKSPDWAYEREWRIVDTVGDDAPGREIRMPTPSRLLLGHRMTPENRAKVIAIAREQGIPVFEMAPSSDGFKLDARLVEEAA